MSYSELCIEERATIQVGLEQGLSIREVASLLERSPSTIVERYDAIDRQMADTVCHTLNSIAMIAE